jgi:hypothetical protein
MMPRMNESVLADRECVRGVARAADLCYILNKSKELLEKDVAHTSVIGIYRGDWAKATVVRWNATAAAVAKKPSEQLVVIGEDGQAFHWAAGKANDEQLSPKPKLIRAARTIDGEVYACGMKREVYRRVDVNVWKVMSAPKPGKKETTGFEAIDGYSAKEIYAVGWSGEIWQYDGKEWTKRRSGKDQILTAVCCAPDGTVYAAGQRGLMLMGRHDAWKRITWKDDVSVDLWDLCWFNDVLYVAANDGLFTLKNRSLVPVDFGDAAPATFFSLSTSGGVLWSVGPSDVASFDGSAWRQYS